MKLIFLFSALLLVFFVKSNYYDKSKSNNFNNNIIFLIDISHSMNVKDVSNETRLKTSKKFIKEKLSSYSGNNKNINVGIILFSNINNYFIPPTSDYITINRYLKDINTNYLPNGKTNLSGAINKFINSSSNGIKGVILSDLGGNNKINLEKYKDKLENKNLSLSTIGIGTKKGGYVTYPDKNFVYYEGEKVVDKLNENLGKEIADNYNGKYYHLTNLNNTDEINLLKNNDISFKNSKKTKKVLETLIGVFTAIGL